mgnify:CR=1 FL=1
MEASWDKMIGRIFKWFESAIINLPNFILAVVIFSFSFWMSRNIERWANRALTRVITQTSVRSLISNALSILIITVGFFLALGVLNLDDLLKSLLAGAGVAGLAIGLALQGTLSNTFSGIFLAVEDILNVDDWIESNGYAGRVVEIDLRNTKIIESDNNIVVIPNKTVLENPFKNYGLTKRIRTNITCGVAYDSDLRQVKDLSIKTIDELFPIRAAEAVEFHYLNFGDSSIDFQIRFWIDAKVDITATEAKSEAIMALKEAFDENGITIPFPIRTVIQETINQETRIEES